MREVSLEELLEAGSHFGHQVTRSNPKAREFIFEARDNIHIIDLAITKQWLEEAGAFVLSLSKNPGTTMVVVGTKRQASPIVTEQVKKAQEAIRDDAQKESVMYVSNKWIGGFLTNFSEVSKNLKKLKNIEEILGQKDSIYTKKELGLFEKEKQKLESLYGGIRNITKVPDVLFIIDSKMEELAVREANRTGVKSVAIVDTNSDPALVDYPIPANDDAVGSIELIAKYILEAWAEGKNSAKQNSEKPKTESEKPKTVSLKTEKKTKAASVKTSASQGESAKISKVKKVNS